jgi:hypothetical protein
MHENDVAGLADELHHLERDSLVLGLLRDESSCAVFARSQ